MVWICVHYIKVGQWSSTVRILSRNLRSNSAIEFYLVTLEVRSRNCGVELASNVDRIRVPTVDDQPLYT